MKPHGASLIFLVLLALFTTLTTSVYINHENEPNSKNANFIKNKYFPPGADPDLLQFKLQQMHRTIDGGSSGYSAGEVFLHSRVISTKDALTAKNIQELLSTPHHNIHFAGNVHEEHQEGQQGQGHVHPYIVKFKRTKSTMHQLLTHLQAQFPSIHIPTATSLYYLPHDAYIVYMDPSDAPRLMSQQQHQQQLVDFVVPYRPSDRLSRELISRTGNSNFQLTTVNQHKARLSTTQGQEQQVDQADDAVVLGVKVALGQAHTVAQDIMQSTGSSGNSNVVVVSARAITAHKVIVTIRGGNTVDTDALKEHAVDVAQIVAHHRHVLYVESMVGAMITQVDNRHARWVMQSNTPRITPYNKGGIGGGGESDSSLLTGRGQVIGYGDSGLDVYGCFMHDDKDGAKVPFTDHFDPNSTHIDTSKQHRKIAGYYAFMDGVDDLGGHGTHVGGTLAGRMMVSGTESEHYNGQAYDAKLAFMDLGCSSPGGCTCAKYPLEQRMCPCTEFADGVCPSSEGALYMPLALDEGYFPFSYAQGARIHSNSIGGVIGEGYSLTSEEIDRFMYEHDDFLVIWSAGNSGRNEGFQTLTGGMKQFKNGIVVGAGTAPEDSWPDVFERFWDYDSRAKMLHSSLSKAYGCECTTDCNAKQCASIAPLVDHAGCCTYMDITQPGDVCKTPLPRSATYPLLTNVVTACCKTCALRELEKSETVKSLLKHQNIAIFSSLGPAMDGRIKPDVISPGFYTLSASSHASEESKKCTAERAKDLQFNVKPMAGTSMATPTMAGTAALVRQYFADGLYPADEDVQPSANVPQYTAPSAALVKATVLNSARPMTGIARDTKGFEYYQPAQRRFFEGFGLVNLANTLKIKGRDEVTPFSLFVADRKRIRTGVEHVYTVKIINKNEDKDKGKQPLTVTLVWTDPPASPAAALALVNDLDLLVTRVDTGDKWLGNALDDSMQHSHDHLNNVEKITLHDVAPGTTYTITVRGFHVPQGPDQQYALVVTGPSFSRGELERSFYEIDIEGGSFLTRPVSMQAWLFILLVLLALGAVVLLSGAIVVLTVTVVVQRKKLVQGGSLDESTSRAHLNVQQGRGGYNAIMD